MPIYEYRCDACDVTFERLRRASDDSPVTCPECHDEARKLLSTFAAPSDGGSSAYSAPSAAPACAPGGG